MIRHGDINCRATVWPARAASTFSQLSSYVETIGGYATVFLHMVPRGADTATRIPLGALIASSAADPIIRGTIGTCLIIYPVGATFQKRHLRAGWQRVAG